MRWVRRAVIIAGIIIPTVSQANRSSLPINDMVAFLDLAQQYVEHSLRANKRSDNLYHAYNILHLGDKHASISHLYEMLEGQVAILSSGLLSGEESLALLESLRHSQLYRARPAQLHSLSRPEAAGFSRKELPVTSPGQ